MKCNNDDIKYMRQALKEAQKAREINEIPIGAVVVYKGKIIARGHNQTILRNDPSAHAEMLVLRKAAKKLENYRLLDCKIYATIEPCAMCAGALVWSRISEIIYGAEDKKAGACGSVFNIVNNKRLNHRIKVTRGVLETECKSIIQGFFKDKR